MKRFKLAVIFSLLGLNISAQNKLSFSFDFAPTLSYRNYKLNYYSQVDNRVFPFEVYSFDNFKNIFDYTKSPKYGFQISLYMNYSITNKLSIQAGIQYKNIDNRYYIKPLLGILYINGLFYYDYGDNRVALNSKLNYIGIPICVQYKVFSFNKFYLAINIGSTIDFLSSHEKGLKVIPNISLSQKANIIIDYSKKTLNVNGGIKLSYIINEKWDAYIMPKYEQYLTPNEKIGFYYGDFYSKINQYNYFLTLKFGINYRI